MYKRDRFVFVSNLQDITCDPENPNTLKREAYLLSEPYTNARRVQQMLFARGRQNLIVSDNGNYSRMVRIAKDYKDASQSIVDRALEHEDRDEALPASLRRERARLIKQIEEDCVDRLAQQDALSNTSRQLQIRPHLMIGLEDFTVPVLSLAGLMHPVFEPAVGEIKGPQARTRALFKQQLRGTLGTPIPDETRLVCVIHAVDYASAFLGGKRIRNRREIESIAISYGAPMQSRQWISELKVGRKMFRFEEKLPEAYLAAQRLTVGVVRGVKRKKIRLHILGAGSPIVLVLTALFSPRVESISIDSTAPFKDAYQGRIYAKRNAFLKMRMYRAAAFHLIDGSRFESSSPFWKSFERKHKSDWKTLRLKLGVTKDSDLKTVAAELRKRQDLVQKYIPYFTRAGVGSKAFQKDVRIARAGSNYWVLKAICDRVRSRLDEPDRIRSWVEKEIARYRKFAHPRWAEAVEQAYEMSR